MSNILKATVIYWIVYLLIESWHIVSGSTIPVISTVAFVSLFLAIYATLEALR